MDVRCERCQSEYQVEDAKVSDRGTEVQCSDCGHLFVVKRPGNAASLTEAGGGNAGENMGTWIVETTQGKSLRLRDMTALHKWIIERRVRREDRLSRDGAPWQRLGDMGELTVFFDIVDSAERARTADTPMPAPLPAPLAVPALTPPVPAPQPSSPGPSGFESTIVPASSAQPLLASMKAQSKAQNRVATAALPSSLYDTDADETVIVSLEPAKKRGFLKLGIMVLVAGVVACAGILWQHHRLGSTPSSFSTTSESARAPHAPAVGVPAPAPVLGQKDHAAEESEEEGRAKAGNPVVGPIGGSDSLEDVQLLGKGSRHASAVRPAAGRRAKLPSPASERAHRSRANAAKPNAPQSLAAQGYVALDHRQPSRAISLFKRALAGTPNNGTALFGLAEAHREAGQSALALQAYRRYVELLPSGPDAGSARHHIRVLESKRR